MANCSLIYNILRVIKIFESRKSFIPSHSPPPPSEYLLGNPIRLETAEIEWESVIYLENEKNSIKEERELLQSGWRTIVSNQESQNHRNILRHLSLTLPTSSRLKIEFKKSLSLIVFPKSCLSNGCLKKHSKDKDLKLRLNLWSVFRHPVELCFRCTKLMLSCRTHISNMSLPGGL